MKKEFIIEPEKRLPVLQTDVLVVGAGTAGCLAAIAAARQGAKVIIIEKLPVPSGTLSNGGNSIHSFWNQVADPEKAIRIVDGLPWELVQRVIEAGGSDGFETVADTHKRIPFNTTLNHEVVKGVLCEMLEEAGVHVYLQTNFCSLLHEGDKITAAIIENKDGRSAIVANQYIDASGDGDVARRFGVKMLENWDRYDQVCGGPTSLPFALGGVDFDKACREAPEAFIEQANYDSSNKDDDYRVRTFFMVPYQNPERFKEICDLDIRKFTSIYSRHPGDATNINNSKGLKVDASTADGLTQAELAMRKLNVKLAKAIKDTMPGFEQSFLTWQPMQIGIRSSKIATCDYMLTQEEITAAKRFEDEIGLYGYHDLAASREHCYCQAPYFYGLPYRMLLPEGCSNLFMAGRCVTIDIEAHMSTRSTVACMIMGQAAGIAAALCAEKNCDSRALPYPELRRKLLEQKVILDV